MTTLTIQTPAITSTSGVFSCTALDAPLAVGQAVLITGTFSSGSITGYHPGATYFVVGTPTTTAFQLSATKGGAPVTTTVSTGAITGINVLALNKQAVIWGKNLSDCVDCVLAAKVAVAGGYDYTFLNIDTKDFNKADLIALVPNVKTVPQVFLDGVYVGGLKELKAKLKL